MNRRMLLESLLSASRLPAEFQEVEYIESSGTQYINSGYAPTDNTEVKLSFSNDTTGENAFLFGSRISTSSGQFGCYRDGYGVYLGRYQNSDISSGITSANYISLKKNVFTVNETQITFTNTLENNVYNIFIFKINTAGSSSANGAKYQLKYFKIYNNGTIVRDFVPCYRKADNEIGLYDLVNGVFYTNAGTGSFTKGGNV